MRLAIPFVALALAACGPSQVKPVGTDGAPADSTLRITPPAKSVFLRASFDDDPATFLGRFLPDDTAVAQVDENAAAQTRCSRFVAHKVVRAGGQYDETLNSALGVSAQIGVNPVGQAGGQFERGTALRVTYTLTAKMRAEISDPDGFAQCCAAAPDQCSNRFVGEFLRGTGQVYQYAGAEDAVKAGGNYQAIAAELDFKQGAAWKRVTRFDDLYFAFRTQAARLGDGAPADPDDCSWAEVVPKSLDGEYFVGTSQPLASEGLARDDAVRNATLQAVRFLGEHLQATRTSSSSAIAGYLEDEQVVQSVARGITRRVKAERFCAPERQPTPEGEMFVARTLVFFPKAQIEAAAAEAVGAIKETLKAGGELDADAEKALDAAKTPEAPAAATDGQ